MSAVSILADLVEMACRADRRIVFARDGDRFDVSAFAPDRQQIDALTAALWRLCIEMPDTDRVCPTCSGSTHAIDVGRFVDPAIAARGRRDSLRLVEIWPGYGNARVLLGGCPTCRDEASQRGIGRVRRSWGDVLLGAEQADREALDVHADSIMDMGDRIGEWLALWLARARCVKCRGSQVARSVLSHAHEREWHGHDLLHLVLDGPVHVTSSAREFIFKFQRRLWAADEVTTEHSQGREIAMRWRTTLRARSIDDVEPMASFDCPHCGGLGLELGAREQAIAERIEPLTWITGRTPAQGDEVEIEALDNLWPHASGRVVEMEPVRLQANDRTLFDDDRAVIMTAGGYAAIVYWSTVKRWRYRVHSTGAQASADHRADPRPAAPRDAW